MWGDLQLRITEIHTNNSMVHLGPDVEISHNASGAFPKKDSALELAPMQRIAQPTWKKDVRRPGLMVRLTTS
jgi:hypothetical protein